MLDFIEFQAKIRQATNEKELFELTSQLCTLREKGMILKYEFDELNDFVKDRFRVFRERHEELAKWEAQLTGVGDADR
jgi:hypothetical protein